MLKKFFVFFIFLFLFSCWNNSNSGKNPIEDTKKSSWVVFDSKDENIKETLKNWLQVNKLTLNIINNICENLEWKVDYILEWEEKISEKIEVISFIENYIKEDKIDDYNNFISLKNGEINWIYKKFENEKGLQIIFDEFKNKEDFFFYLSNYMLFLNKDRYSLYVEKYLDFLRSSKEEIRETPFIGIILAEFKQNKSCWKFIKDKFISN